MVLEARIFCVWSTSSESGSQHAEKQRHVCPNWRDLLSAVSLGHRIRLVDGNYFLLWATCRLKWDVTFWGCPNPPSPLDLLSGERGFLFLGWGRLMDSPSWSLGMKSHKNDQNMVHAGFKMENNTWRSHAIQPWFLPKGPGNRSLALWGLTDAGKKTVEFSPLSDTITPHQQSCQGVGSPSYRWIPIYW